MYAVAQVVKLLGRHTSLHTLADIVVIDILPHDGHAVGTYDAQKRLILVTPRFGDNKGNLHILLLRHATCETVTGCT